MNAKRRAFLIASSRFEAEPQLSPLIGPENDVDAMQEVLQSPGAGNFDDVIVLKNKPSQEVRVALNQAIRNAASDDLLLIYFSGHGKLDFRGRLCLTMADTQLSVLESTSIRMTEIKDFLDVGRCRKVVLILDCCYSGAVGKSFTRGSVDDQMQITAENCGMAILTASTALETAMEKEDGACGVFTRHLVDGIKSGEADRDGDGVITLDEWYDYVHEKVLAEGRQRPQKWDLRCEGRLEIAFSGRDFWEEKRGKIRDLVLDLARDKRMPDRLVSAALAAISVAKTERSDGQQKLCALLEGLETQKVTWDDFLFAAVGSISEAPKPPPPPPPPLPPPPPALKPVLQLSAREINFGEVKREAQPRRELKIRNTGEGELMWSFSVEGEPFLAIDKFTSLEKETWGLVLRILPDLGLGRKRETLHIHSNGGEASVEALAQIISEPPPPPPTLIHPGRWLIEMSAYGMVSSRFVLDLFPNGVLQGSQELWGIQAPLTGGWSFDPNNNLLEMNLVANVMGMPSSDVVAIRLTGAQGGRVSGVDQMMRSYVLAPMV
jgi:hypothetical protein